MSVINLSKRKVFTIPVGIDITKEVVKEAISLHLTKLRQTYIDNENMYMSNFVEISKTEKPNGKPNNKLTINYAKYIVDTFSGYHLGIPMTVKHENDEVNQFVQSFRNLNDMNDTEFELAKMMDVFGHAFIYVYQDEESNTRATYNSPVNMFIVHDSTVSERPVFAVRYVLANGDTLGFGEVITKDYIQEFSLDSKQSVTFVKEEIMHPYATIPVIETIENEERQGIFESVKTLINALNKAVSEKANDVDYFADAYLKITGMKLDADIITSIKDNRILNLWSNDGSGGNMDANFLDKPNADTTQENLINLLKEHITKISMVADLSDKDFGNASGTALAYKLQAMDNLAKTKDRKLQSAFNRMYEVVFSVPKSAVSKEEWKNLEYTFTRNIPRNLLEESQIVSQLDGQVSNETKMSVLFFIYHNPYKR